MWQDLYVNYCNFWTSDGLKDSKVSKDTTESKNVNVDTKVVVLPLILISISPIYFLKYDRLSLITNISFTYFENHNYSLYHPTYRDSGIEHSMNLLRGFITKRVWIVVIRGPLIGSRIPYN